METATGTVGTATLPLWNGEFATTTLVTSAGRLAAARRGLGSPAV